MRKHLALLVLPVLLLSGCWTYTTDTNTVIGGSSLRVFFKKRATDQVVDQLHYGLNHGDEHKTLSEMLGFAKSNLFKTTLSRIGFGLSDFDYFFDPENEDDFEGAAAAVHNNDRCLVMDRSVWPWADDRHNWTFREDADQYCIPGKAYG